MNASSLNDLPRRDFIACAAGAGSIVSGREKSVFGDPFRTTVLTVPGSTMKCERPGTRFVTAVGIYGLPGGRATPGIMRSQLPGTIALNGIHASRHWGLKSGWPGSS